MIVVFSFTKKYVHDISDCSFNSNDWHNKHEQNYLRSTLHPAMVLRKIGFPVSVVPNEIFALLSAADSKPPLVAVLYELEVSLIFSLP